MFKFIVKLAVGVMYLHMLVARDVLMRNVQTASYRPLLGNVKMAHSIKWVLA